MPVDTSRLFPFRKFPSFFQSIIEQNSDGRLFAHDTTPHYYGKHIFVRDQYECMVSAIVHAVWNNTQGAPTRITCWLVECEVFLNVSLCRVWRMLPLAD